MTLVDSFCSAQMVSPIGGDVVLFGGDIWDGTRTTHQGNQNSLTFNPDTPLLTRDSHDMWRPRWYATATSLPSGKIYIQGGRGGADRPELRNSDGTFTLLSSVDTSSLYYFYPRNFVAPDGRIFGVADRTMYHVNLAASSPTLTVAGTMSSAGPTGVTSSEAMYEPGKILRTGGGANWIGGTIDGKRTWAVIDIRGTMPVVQQSSASNPMPAGLHWHNATVIADGRVVVTGGSLKNNTVTGANYSALIWKPTAGTRTGTWTKGAATSSNKARLYHSIALLLPDATLLVAGGGAAGGAPNNLNAEIYNPPYLYTSSGEVAPRPIITSAPSVVGIGEKFNLTFSSASQISRVTFVKTGSVTHSFNMDQRFMQLTFTGSGNTLTVTAPTNANVATPGRYLLFIINARGVPSVARIVTVPVAS